MTSHRAVVFSSRWQGFASGLNSFGCSAITTRLSSTKAQAHTPIVPRPRVSAFEQAMQEIHGDQWKERLNRSQRNYVGTKERNRQIKLEWLKSKTGGQIGTPIFEDSDVAAWHEKVERLKTELLQKKKENKTETRSKATTASYQPQA